MNRPSRRSATVPFGGQTEAEVLEARRAAWGRRPLTREVYRRYFEAIRAELAPGPRTIEIGGGAGHFKEACPSAWVSDLVATRHVDFVADAMRLPVADGCLDNLVLVDVLHHLPRPAAFFTEAVRALRPGGRVVLLEPYISPASWVVFRLFHPEPVDLAVDPLPTPDRPVFAESGAFASNQAIPTLVLFRHLHRFRARFPELAVVTRRLDSVLAYPLSGGFSGPCLAPRVAHGAVWAAERWLGPLRRMLAFRMLVTLERTTGNS